MLVIIFLAIQLLFAGFILFLCLAFMTGAPYVPSDNKTARAMIRLAKLKPSDHIIDVGSGDGRLLFLANRQGAHALGYEINPFLVWFTNTRAWFMKNKNVQAVWTDFWKIDVRHADVVFVYLLPWRMKQLQKKLEKELKPGTRVISNSFIFPGWNVEDHDGHVYAYTIGKKQNAG